MKRETTRCGVFTGALFAALLAISVVAEAGTINAGPYFGTGPGGSGSTIIVAAADAGNDDVTGTTSDPSLNLQALSASFTAVAPIDFVFNVTADNPLLVSAGTEYFFNDVTINNTTTSVWTDFHFQLGMGTGATFATSPGDGIDFDAPLFTPTPDSNVFTSVATSEDDLVFSGGGTVAPGGGLVEFTFSIDLPFVTAPPMGNFTLRMFPTVTVAAVPEPGTALFLGSALILGAAILRRKGSVRRKS